MVGHLEGDKALGMIWGGGGGWVVQGLSRRCGGRFMGNDAGIGGVRKWTQKEGSPVQLVGGGSQWNIIKSKIP